MLSRAHWGPRFYSTSTKVQTVIVAYEIKKGKLNLGENQRPSTARKNLTALAAEKTEEKPWPCE